jgi:hypothetical protein
MIIAVICLLAAMLLSAAASDEPHRQMAYGMLAGATILAIMGVYLTWSYVSPLNAP